MGRIPAWTVALVCGVLWMSFLMQNGVRLTGDSALFIDLALDLFVEDGEAIPTTRAPLYIWLVAAASNLTTWPASAADLVVGGSFLTLLVVLAEGAWRASRDWMVSAVLVLVTATWPMMLDVFDVGWTEGTFTALALASMVGLAAFIEDDRVDALAVAAVAAGLGMLTRYMGLAQVGMVALVGGLAVLSRFRGGDTRGAMLRAAATAPAGLLPALWLLRNRALDGTWTGERQPARTGWLENLELMGATMRDAMADSGVLTALVVGSLAVGAWGLAQRHRDGRSKPALALAANALTTFTYLALVVWGTSRVSVDKLSIRYIAPILPALAFLVAQAWGLLRRGDRALLPAGAVKPGRAALTVTLTTVLLAQLGPWAAAVRVTTDREGGPAHHNHDGWKKTKTAADLSALLQETLGDDTERTIATMTYPNSMIGSTFWLRGAGLDGAELLELGERTKKRRNRDLRVVIDGKERLIHALTLTPSVDVKYARTRLEELGDQEPPPLVVVSIPGLKTLKGGGKSIATLAPKGKVLESVGQALPYEIYQLIPRAEADPEKTPEVAKPPDVTTALGVDWKAFGPSAPYVTVDGDVVSIKAGGPPQVRVCGPKFKPESTVVVSGEVRADGIDKGKGGRVTVGFYNKDNRWVKTADNDVLWAVHVVTGTFDWVRFDGSVKRPKGSVQARICMDMPAKKGTAGFRRVRLQPASAAPGKANAPG